MKNILNFYKIGVLFLLLSFAGCKDFLDRPLEDNYTIDGFYKTDLQCYQAANILYNSPWHDYIRGYFKIGDVMAGNIYMGIDNRYQLITVNSANEDLVSASNALWLLNGHANAVIENISKKAGPNVTGETKNAVTGEAMLWKAMAYFYLVRAWGAVPIVHSNSAIVGAGTANTLKKIRVEDVYEYLIRTAKRASQLLPVQPNQAGRLHKYSAYGLIAKAYLAKSGWGQSGSRNQAELDSAAKYAKMVIDEYTGVLEPEYSNLFRITGNTNSEALISLRWVVGTQWTASSYLQSEFALRGEFTGLADSWGDYVGLTVDLEQLFDESPLNATRNNTDSRRKSTMMMRGDVYPYFWRTSGGFVATFDDNNNISNSAFNCPTGTQCVKHIVGHTSDHTAEAGEPSQYMKTSLATHLLRLADVYLIYAEAVLGNNASTSDGLALLAFNRVKRRAITGWTDATSITFDDIFNERRREFACEGDNWFDYVRLAYYNPTLALSKINAQERGYFDNAQLKEFYLGERTAENVTFTSFKLNLTSADAFQLPFPETDLNINPNLMPDVEPEPFDFSQIDY